MNNYAALLEYQPEPLQVQAGIERIGQFGFFATVDALAGGNPLNYDLIMSQPARTIYTKLLLDQVKADYQKEYSKLINKKPESNGL